MQAQLDFEAAYDAAVAQPPTAELPSQLQDTDSSRGCLFLRVYC